MSGRRSLSVISSNIRYDEPDDDDHRWKNRRDFLARRLLDYKPDIVATQEGRHPQICEIDERLTGLRCADAHRQWDSSLMYPCIFYNPATLTLSDSGDIWLSKSPERAGSSSFGSAFPRLCTWALFDDALLAINVHLDNVNADARLHQIQVLMQQVDAMKTDGPLLLMGDFNEPPDCPVRSEINATWPELRDPWFDLGRSEESTHHHFHQDIDYGSRVDWILANKALQPKEILLDKSSSDDGIFPSDHYLLKARFLFRK